MFDPQSPVCLTSVSAPYCARFVGPGMVERGGLQHCTDAQARARGVDIAVTVCGGFTLNSGRQQHTMSS